VLVGHRSLASLVEIMCLLNECFVFLCETYDTTFIIGDFNLPHIDWESSDSPEDQIHSVFLDSCLTSGLNQFINESTSGNNIFVLSNDKLIVSDLNVTCPFSSGDPNNDLF